MADPENCQTNVNNNDDDDVPVTMDSSSPPPPSSVEEQLHQRDQLIADLQRTIEQRDERIRELVSQLDKCRSVLRLTGPTTHLETDSSNSGGRKIASTAVGRKLHRAWGISAEPQSSLTGERTDLTAALTRPSQKFYKDHG